MNCHVTAVECRQLFGQLAKVAGLYAMAINQTSYLHAAIGQVINQMAIAYIPVDDGRAILHYRLDNEGTILLAALKRKVTRPGQHLTDRHIVICAPGRPVIGVEASATQITFSTVALNESRPLAKIGDVL